MQGTLTQLEADHTLEKLTTSTKSVADYFKDRLRSKGSGSSSSLLSSGGEKEGGVDVSRGGLGSSRIELGTIEDNQSPRMGLGMGASKFGTLMSGAFLASLPTASTREEANASPAYDSEPDRKPVAEATSGEKMEQVKPKKGEKKDKRKRDGKGKEKVRVVERTDLKDEDDEAEKPRRKKKSENDRGRKDTSDDHDLVQEQLQLQADDAYRKKSDKKERKERKEKAGGKGATRVSDA